MPNTRRSGLSPDKRALLDLWLKGERISAPPIERVGREEPLPLSFGQQRLWFLHQLDPESPQYNVPAALRLNGELDRSALTAALSQLMCASC